MRATLRTRLHCRQRRMPLYGSAKRGRRGSSTLGRPVHVPSAGARHPVPGRRHRPPRPQPRRDGGVGPSPRAGPAAAREDAQVRGDRAPPGRAVRWWPDARDRRRGGGVRRRGSRRRVPRLPGGGRRSARRTAARAGGAGAAAGRGRLGGRGRPAGGGRTGAGGARRGRQRPPPHRCGAAPCGRGRRGRPIGGPAGRGRLHLPGALLRARGERTRSGPPRTRRPRCRPRPTHCGRWGSSRGSAAAGRRRRPPCPQRTC